MRWHGNGVSGYAYAGYRSQEMAKSAMFGKRIEAASQVLSLQKLEETYCLNGFAYIMTSPRYHVPSAQEPFTDGMGPTDSPDYGGGGVELPCDELR